VKEGHLLHDYHCLQFLAQALLCRADGGLLPVSPGLSLELSGEGRVYKCRDWRGIRDHVLENVERWDGIPYVGVEVLKL
jgi:hypothetical protein